MNSTENFPAMIEALEANFSHVREAAISDYERELSAFREEREYMSGRGDRYTEEIAALVEGHGANGDALFRDLAALWSKHDKELQALLETDRSPLIEAEQDRHAAAREQAAHSAFVAGTDWEPLHLVGADILAPEADFIGRPEEEVGNPGTWLYPKNSREVLLKHTAKGSGSGCVGRPVPVPAKSIWYYTWRPPQAGKYLFWSGCEYFGFYFLVADDGCFSCKRAAVRAVASTEIYQHWWRGKNSASILDFDSQNIKKGGILQGSKKWKVVEYLDTSPIVVKAEVFLFAHAKGSGSYAEVNFKDSKDAHISAPTILVSGA
jgi:hypothetical protein